MAYICNDPLALVGKPVRGNGQCAVLVQLVTRAPLTGKWKAGEKVRGNSIPVGAAIATFDANGHYPNRSTGNHAALYISQNATGISVVEQYVPLEKIQERHIRFHHTANPANDGNAYSLIE